MFHPTIKLTVEHSKWEADFLNVNIKLIDKELKTGLFVKPTDTHQFLDPTTCHLFYRKKSVHFSQALNQFRILGQKVPSTSFSPLTSTNVGINS